jgi:hypothetical protein
MLSSAVEGDGESEFARQKEMQQATIENNIQETNELR